MLPLSDWLDNHVHTLEARLIASAVVADYSFGEVRCAVCIGYYRLRIRLVNDDLIQVIERLEWSGQEARTSKYSFHWQQNDGTLIRRWDNAPHHRTLATFPHHLHEKSEDNVLPHLPINCLALLDIVEKTFNSG